VARSDQPADASPECETEVMDAEDPMFILYTSGTTGKPKGQLHTCGGYQVHIATTLKYVFDLKEDDRYWCAADPGWITGHSYIVYAPMILGATSFIYEGAPGYPNPDRWWEQIEKYGISILYTAPTAIRALCAWAMNGQASHASTCACSARWVNRSIPKRGAGIITRTLAKIAARSWTPGGRPKPAAL
jgi:acyl-coenzyme A synthetase/AMP-(fatty) acid ligase